MESMTVCPECGALTVDGLNCWAQLGAILAWEWQDPELLAVHFLTVASYNLQHPAQFTDAAVDGLRAAFIDHLEQGTPVATLRRRVSQFAEGSQRVLKDESERRPILRVWSMTIADVYLPDQPNGAADRIRRWAAAIRAEVSGPGLPARHD
jgi:hypothetical protein